MLAIDGTLQVVPLQIAAEVGTMRVGDDPTPQPAVVLSCATANGIVNILFPEENIGGVIRALENAKEQAAGKGGLIVAGDVTEANKMAAAKEASDRELRANESP